MTGYQQVTAAKNGLSVTVRIHDDAGEQRQLTGPAADLSAEFPPPPTDLGTFKESITKTTFTETKTTRVTNNALRTSTSLSSLN